MKESILPATVEEVFTFHECQAVPAWNSHDRPPVSRAGVRVRTCNRSGRRLPPASTRAHVAVPYEERFEPRHGPLRSVVRCVVEEYLECGRPEGGFARIRCRSCRGEHLLAFGCQTRNFCPSCQAKRAALFAEHLVEDVLRDVPHRHVVFTVPKLVRGLFERARGLLSILPRCAHEAVQRVLREAVGDRRAQVGTVASARDEVVGLSRC